MRIVVADGNLSTALHVLCEYWQVSEATQREWFIPRAERRRLKAKRHRAQQTAAAHVAKVQRRSVINPRIPTRTPIELGTFDDAGLRGPVRTTGQRSRRAPDYTSFLSRIPTVSVIRPQIACFAPQGRIPVDSSRPAGQVAL